MKFHPAFGAVVPFRIERLSDDPDTATAETIARMSEYARDDADSPIVQRATREATAYGRSKLEKATGIFDWIRRHVRFVPDSTLAYPIAPGEDPDYYEVLVRPIDILRMPEPQGDCDDFAMLCCSMLTAAGIRSYFVTVAAAPDDPGRWSHVYVYADLDQPELLPLDTSHGAMAGWEVARFSRRGMWGVSPMLERARRGRSIAGSARGGLASNGDSFLNFDLTQGYPVATGGGSAGASSPGWWQGALNTGLEIALRRFGNPPAGTYVQTAQGTYSRGVPGAVPYPGGGGGVSVGVGSGIGTTGFVVLGVAAVALLMMMSRGGRR